MLEIKHVTKRYGEKYALQAVSLSLSEGVYGLLGPNGAGKSTLMNIITDNLKADSGEVCWDGIAVKKLGAQYRSLLGYAPQQQGLYESFTGRRFLCYMGTLKGIRKKQMHDEIEHAAGYVNLLEKLDRPVGTYSGGMKQRLLIAQAMMGDPRLLILDEPTAGLDPKERVRIREKIKELSAGRIVLMATHVVSDIQSIAKEIIVLKAGEVAARDTVDALCSGFGGAKDLEEVYMKLFGEEADHE
ncbi:ABC transporter ATP-binding protein [Candidatus Soleaferrea massiliensis]|uniref:ABC transporter ATP-binding protein n=1 Tax=Candidatus Soleaferrea massiliensis TaxID=1470354 RepID=UPI00058E8942|nr:ATP-binding cassette domain-containing protein [Candidatus Soleaferrea massiliensis]